MLSKLAQADQNLSILKLPHRSIKIVLGLNDESAVAVDYLQSSPTRIDELPIHMVQPHSHTNESIICYHGKSLVDETESRRP